nr:amidophosphoribosyltransferase [Sneathiella glossodoripedis]
MIIHLVANSKKIKVVDRIVDAMHKITGAYSLVALTSKKMVGMRDPHGVRPLVLGKLDNAYILASETCALDIIGAEFIRDVAPGEVIVIDENGMSSSHPFTPPAPRFCIFEHIYFARPDSVLENRSVYEVRKDIGRQLAIENPVDVDAVIPVPDSGTPAAIGYAEQSGVPFELGIIRNHYVGRTFIEPTDQIRHLGVKLKHNANRAMIEGKRVVLVDDSIVRGTTSTKIVQMVREAGATEVHMRIASPPTTHSCFYGVDTPSRQKLLAAQYDLHAMCKFIGADSLSFISLDGLYKAMGETSRNAELPQYCDACFTGDYPIDLVDNDSGAEKELTLLAERS